MRLTCDVDIVNRLLPSFNMKKASRSSRAQISLGRKPGSNSKDGIIFLMVCTAKDRNGSKFGVKGNVEQMFAKFVNEGKATIRIKEPQQDICLSKADPLQLKNFLNLVRLAAQGKNLERVTLSSLAPASAKNVEKPKSKLTVLSKRDYPMTTNFPGSLEFLQISHCAMKRIDSRILQLKKLQTLNLAHNHLPELPEDFGKLSLSELSVKDNRLASFPPCLWKSQVCSSLVLLDLSENQMKSLPVQLCELTNLVNMKLDNNSIEMVPPTIGKLKRLKFLSLTNNLIKMLPASFVRLQLENLDLYGNPFYMSASDGVTSSQLTFPSLLECCARSIKKYRVPYTNEDLFAHLCHYLDSARQCWCGSYCFQCCARYISSVDLHQLSSIVTAWDSIGSKTVPVEAFLCSQHCLTKFQQNPHAYWRK